MAVGLGPIVEVPDILFVHAGGNGLGVKTFRHLMRKRIF